SFNGVRFWDTGLVQGRATTIDVTPGAAGRFTYFCSLHFFTGVVNIPPQAASPQLRHVPFMVTWASAVHPNYVEDIQVKKPHATRFVTWIAGSPDTGAPYTAGKRGTYKFRARIRSTDGSKTAFSTPIAVHVS